MKRLRGPRPRVDVTAFRSQGRRSDRRHGRDSGCNHRGVQQLPASQRGRQHFFSRRAFTFLRNRSFLRQRQFFPCLARVCTFVGGNGTISSTGAAQFNRAPQVRLVVNNAGSNPNGAAVFSMTYPMAR